MAPLAVPLRRVTVMIALPAFSAKSNTGAASSIVPATSSSVMVSMAVLGGTIVTAPVGFPRVRSTVRAPLTPVSFRIGR